MSGISSEAGTGFTMNFGKFYIMDLIPVNVRVGFQNKSVQKSERTP